MSSTPPTDTTVNLHYLQIVFSQCHLNTLSKNIPERKNLESIINCSIDVYNYYT